MCAGGPACRRRSCSTSAWTASPSCVATPEFFAELARAFLLDEDGPGPKPKMSAYYCGIVKGKD